MSGKRTSSGEPRRVVALAGGTGSAKLLRGLASLDLELTVIANVGDNVWVHGLYVCPDVDIAMYTLAGVADRRKGWGVKGDSFAVLGELGRLGEETWFTLGDKDLATHIIRTRALRERKTLTEATEFLCRRFRSKGRVLPATDSEVETRIVTHDSEMNLQEFWVKNQGRPSVRGVRYERASMASITRESRDAIGSADAIVVCPANPITSIGPMLAVGGFLDALVAAPAPVSALSPTIGAAPFSGPAGKLMKATGNRPDSLGVAALYSGFADSIIIDRSDARLAAGIRRLGMRCHLSDIRLGSPSSEKRLAKELLEA